MSEAAGSLLHDSWTIHASLTLSLLSCTPVPLYSSLPWPHPTEHSHHPTPNSDLHLSYPFPRSWQWLWVFSDLGSQPAVAFPLGQLVEWFQCVGLVHTCKLDTEEASGQGFSTLGDNKEDWKCEQGLHLVWVEFCLHCLPVVTLGMIFTLCMSWFLYLFWATPHTCRILVPWPEIPALKRRVLTIGPLGKDWFVHFKSELIMIVTPHRVVIRI